MSYISICVRAPHLARVLKDVLEAIRNTQTARRLHTYHSLRAWHPRGPTSAIYRVYERKEREREGTVIKQVTHNRPTGRQTHLQMSR